MQKVVIALDGGAEIYIDETVKLNYSSYKENCDRTLLDFVYDQVFNNIEIMQLENDKGFYAFSSNRIIYIKQYKEN